VALTIIFLFLDKNYSLIISEWKYKNKLWIIKNRSQIKLSKTILDELFPLPSDELILNLFFYS